MVSGRHRRGRGRRSRLRSRVGRWILQQDFRKRRPGRGLGTCVARRAAATSSRRDATGGARGAAAPTRRAGGGTRRGAGGGSRSAILSGTEAYTLRQMQNMPRETGPPTLPRAGSVCTRQEESLHGRVLGPQIVARDDQCARVYKRPRLFRRRGGRRAPTTPLGRSIETTRPSTSPEKRRARRCWPRCRRSHRPSMVQSSLPPPRSRRRRATSGRSRRGESHSRRSRRPRLIPVNRRPAR